MIDSTLPGRSFRALQPEYGMYSILCEQGSKVQTQFDVFVKERSTK